MGSERADLGSRAARGTRAGSDREGFDSKTARGMRMRPDGEGFGSEAVQGTWIQTAVVLDPKQPAGRT